MNRILTKGEREVIAGVLFEAANERAKKADAILAAAGFFQQEGTEPDEETNAKLERLAGTIVNRYRVLRKSAAAHGNLGNFLLSHEVTVDCIITIPEQF